MSITASAPIAAESWQNAQTDSGGTRYLVSTASGALEEHMASHPFRFPSEGESYRSAGNWLLDADIDVGRRV